MIRFATGAFVAAFLGASMFDHARLAAIEAQIEPAGLFAVAFVALFVSTLFALIGFAAGTARAGSLLPRPGFELPRDGFGRRGWNGLRAAVRRFRGRKASGFVHPFGYPISRPALDPDAPGVRALRDLCRRDTQALIEAEHRKRLTYQEPVHVNLSFPPRTLGGLAAAHGSRLVRDDLPSAYDVGSSRRPDAHLPEFDGRTDWAHRTRPAGVVGTAIPQDAANRAAHGSVETFAVVCDRNPSAPEAA